MNYYLGIDGGGTKTAYVVIDENNKVVYEAKSGPSSLDTVDFSLTKEMFKKEISKIPFEIKSVFAGLGGMVDMKSTNLVNSALKEILPNAIANSESDTINALYASLSGVDGISVISGTGVAVFGKHNGYYTKVGSYGWQEGDAGSSYDLGHKALCYLAKVYDEIEPESEFSKDLGKAINCNKRTDLVYYFQTMDRTNVASLSRIVTKHQDDPVCKAIIKSSVDDFLLRIKVLYKKLGFVDGCPFGIIGSLGNADTYFKQLLLEGLKEINPNIHLVESKYEADYASALIAKEYYEN